MTSKVVDASDPLSSASTAAGLTPSQVLYGERQAVPVVRKEPYTLANRFRGGERDLRLSNGATDVFLSVLQFALSDLAASQWERALAQWVAWHDQTASGRGCVGFDLEEIAWDQTDFPGQKAFLVRVIDKALTAYRWSELCYEPPWADQHLRQYRIIVERFDLPAQYGRSGQWEWPGVQDKETFCPNHGVHCSYLGWCRVCDDCGMVPQGRDEAPASEV
jgi:hypothetical protein